MPPDFNEPLRPPPEWVEVSPPPNPPPPRRSLWAVAWQVFCMVCVAYTLYSTYQYVARLYYAPTVTPERVVQIKPGMTYAQVYDLFDGRPTHRLMGQYPPGRGGQLEAGSYIWAQGRNGVWCLFGGGVLIRFEMIVEDRPGLPAPEGFPQ